ncbi:MAG TPA: hypothetical protein VF638_12940 [Sphingomonas sp.]|jgi:opacity protein-like surface antigen
MMKFFAAAASLAFLAAAPIAAQLVPTAGRYVDANGKVQLETVANGRREAFQLVAANTPSAAVVVFGGDYIISQTCASYGTLNLQVLGPDGATYQTLIAKTSSDTAGGTGLVLGSYSNVRVTVTGTTGCNAILARVPS